jgi:hypothetical protein
VGDTVGGILGARVVLGLGWPIPPPLRASRRGSDAGVAGAAPVVLEPRNESPGSAYRIASLPRFQMGDDAESLQAAREPPVHHQQQEEEEEWQPTITILRRQVEMLGGSQRPPQQKVVRRQVVVLDDFTMEPLKTGQEAQIPQRPMMVIKRPSVVLDNDDNLQQPPQPTVIRQPSIVLDDFQQPYLTVLKRPSTLLDNLLNTPPVPAQPTPTTASSPLRLQYPTSRAHLRFLWCQDHRWSSDGRKDPST